jgi:hypothetical protein
MNVKNWMNQVDIAWVKAVEKKLGSDVDVKEKNDIRLLARLATGTNGRTELAE